MTSNNNDGDAGLEQIHPPATPDEVAAALEEREPDPGDDDLESPHAAARRLAIDRLGIPTEVRHWLNTPGAQFNADPVTAALVKSAAQQVAEALERVQAGGVQAERMADGLFDFATLRERFATPVTPVVDRLVYPDQTAVVAGAGGSFKSFIVLAVMLALATGRKALGLFDVPERRPVLYVTTEGSRSLLARVLAWCTANSVTAELLDGYLLVETIAPDFYADGPDVDALLEVADEHDVGLVVVDTLARVRGAADENSSQMTTVLATLERFKAARRAAWTVHHANRNGTFRGSTAIRDTPDALLEVTRDGDARRVTIKAEKFRDHPQGDRWTIDVEFAVVETELRDYLDRPVTSLAVHRATWHDVDSRPASAPLPDAGLEGNVDKILRTLADAVGPLTNKELARRSLNVEPNGDVGAAYLAARRDAVDARLVDDEGRRAGRTKLYALTSLGRARLAAHDAGED
ncbi:AAA family ATPase [Demequina pelophila]|uniref:AAA family ATPase n=1 Tax=Demequina pelophila TaxID=1638984 RepID=UPI000784543E|nr:AAA family ATPase [Demequina pelophila]